MRKVGIRTDEEAGWEERIALGKWTRKEKEKTRDNEHIQIWIEITIYGWWIFEKLGKEI